MHRLTAGAKDTRSAHDTINTATTILVLAVCHSVDVQPAVVVSWYE